MAGRPRTRAKRSGWSVFGGKPPKASAPYGPPKKHIFDASRQERATSLRWVLDHARTMTLRELDALPGGYGFDAITKRYEHLVDLQGVPVFLAARVNVLKALQAGRLRAAEEMDREYMAGRRLGPRSSCRRRRY